MQARRAFTPSPTLPSSPPPFPTSQDRSNVGPTEDRLDSSPARTLWTAPSPTQTLGYSSPELPGLPSLPNLGVVSNSPSSSVQHPTDTSYYTASWGSPYRRPPPGVARSAEYGSWGLNSDEVEGESSEIQFGLDHLLPSLVERDPEFGLEHLLPSLLPAEIQAELVTPTRPSHPTAPEQVQATPRPIDRSSLRDLDQSFFTDSGKDWIREYITSQLDTEEGKRWSDESGDSKTQGGSTRRRTPQGKEFLLAENSSNTTSPLAQRQKPKTHKSRQSNLTLRQEDFFELLNQKGKQEFEKMMSSRYADPAVAQQAPTRKPASSVAVEKPLPPSPDAAAQPSLPRPNGRIQLSRHDPNFGKSQPTMPLENHNSVDAVPQVAEPVPQQVETKPPPQSSTPVPRLKKRVLWRGRNCMILIPRDPTRGTEGGPPKPLEPSEVAARLRRYESAGYDVRGYDHRQGEDDFVEEKGTAQNREIYPTPEEDYEVRKSKNFVVHVPNRADWEEYMNFLTEQKLRALGVSLGDDEPQESPVLSRRSSSQYPPLPFSPPIPTSSSDSQRPVFPGVIRTGSFPVGPSPGHSSTRSIASPISIFGNPRGAMQHMHRHSTFTSPASFMHKQSSSPGISTWSPQQYLNQQGFARGGSPALPPLPNSRPDLSDIVSPNSPFGSKAQQQFPFPQQNDVLLAQLQQQQQLLQAQLMQQQQQQQQQHGYSNTRPSSTLQEVPEAEYEDEPPVQNNTVAREDPVIAVPQPRGHQHNISAGLERDIHSAEYHLEKAIDKQLDEGGDFNTESRFGEPGLVKNAQPKANGEIWHDRTMPVQHILHQPQPHNRAHSLTKRPQSGTLDFGIDEGQSIAEDDTVNAKSPSEVETNPSVNGDADGSTLHSKKPSEIINSWSDGQLPRENAEPQLANHHPRPSHVSKPSMSKLNVEAKEFKFNPAASFSPNSFTFSASSFEQSKASAPSSHVASNQHSTKSSVEGMSRTLNVEAPSFKPSGFTNFSMPTGEFCFLSKGLSFKPTAPEFKPGSSVSKTVTDPVPEEAEDPNRIFKLKFGEIVRPAKQSKAVPIVRPDRNAHMNDESIQEDEFGRLGQADGYQKRVRRGPGGDGNDVPQFAIPTHPLSETTDFQTIRKDESRDQKVKPLDKENVAPDDGSDVAQHSSATPFALQEKANMGTVDIPSLDQNLPSFPAPSQRAASAEPTAPIKKHASKNSLSATAKPFEFRSNNGAFDFGLHVTKPSFEQADKVERSQQLASETPTRFQSRSPATTFRHSDDGSYKTAPEPRRHLPYPDSEEGDFDSFVPPTYQEIDDVMKQLDAEGSDFGIVQEEESWDQSSPKRLSRDYDPTDLRPVQHFRSDAPSPSPRRLYTNTLDTGATSTPVTHDPFSDERAGQAYESPVHRLNDGDDIPISEWGDVVSSTEEDKFHSRINFFDSHVDNLIGAVLSKRLDPIEQTLQAVQESIGLFSQPDYARRSRRSASAMESDADDEDDELPAESNLRNRSPRKDRKLEKMRSIIVEALAAYQPQQEIRESPSIDPTEFYQALADIKTSFARSTATNDYIENIKEVIQSALSDQQLAVIESRENDIINESTTRISELENALKEANLRLESEVENHRSTQQRHNDTQRLLDLTEEELSLLKESSRDDRNKLRAATEEIHSVRLNSVTLEAAQDDLRKKLSAVTAQNEALEATLEEYRISSAQWRKDIDEADQEKSRLKSVTAALQIQIEEAMQIRSTMRDRLDILQREMITAAGQVAHEKSQWQDEIQEHRTRYEILSARIEAEARTRERLEKEMERLELQEREAMRLKVTLEHTQHAYSRLEETVNTLRLENTEHQKTAERYEREFREARDAGRVEVERTRRLMEADVENANNQVNMVRADLERELTRVRAELDSVRMEADTTKEKHALMLEQEADARRDALREASNARNIAFKEQHHKYEQHVNELKQQHSRAIHIAHEDKERAELHLNERLALSDAKVEHLRDKVLHLEEKLEVAKSAAQAAVEAAKAAKVPASAVSSGSYEKVSPQALRESILVLQEQLQEREGRIESLEHQLSSLDTEAPNKLKERDTEIGWLRELLGVRVDDLSDLITALSQPAYDREAVRDAAIRIRSNLQMEQQEKERLINGGQNFPTLASLSNFASPKAVQLAAAFGNWRKGNGSSKLAQTSSSNSSRTQTPSKPSPAVSTPGFLSGLMTPPTSNLRRTPEPSSAGASKAPQMPTGRLERGLDLPSLSSRRQEKQAIPSTPPLLRKASYDRDAEDGDYSVNGFYDDEESTMDGNPADRQDNFSRFGPGLHSQLS
ncbi:hypothetical protein M501DRAFT_998743 [Patellaria atrata CBS 101060]|uniref:Uncharacterized protein n=1 Tax=Patellaria atrata CBS 101060 TaxID=1346257 RepID=A0A9P4SHL9_9PEZI|nr:hypothetical protein M501DRAFT_998743 [Patellaria atrata CBS 101060]